jgi:hypothetical protein
MTDQPQEQDEIEQAQQFYAEPRVPQEIEWRRALRALTETEKVMRKAHDVIVAEQETCLRDQAESGLQEPLKRLCARIDEVRIQLLQLWGSEGKKP